MEAIDKNYPFEDVYETILGFRDYRIVLPFVQNAFEDGYPCDKKYDEMRQAYTRICERLGTGDEDPDLDIIVNSLEFIQKEVCKEFYKLSIMLAECAINEASWKDIISRKLMAFLIKHNIV